MKIKFLLIFIIIFQCFSCQFDNKNSTETITKNGYTISYSSDLKLDESGKQGSEFLLFTKRTDSEDNFLENINLIIQKLDSQNLDLNKFVEISENEIETNGKLITSERIKKDNSEFQKLTFSAHLNNFNLKFIQYIFFDNDKAYVLTFTAEENKFEKYSAFMEKIMLTFEIR